MFLLKWKNDDSTKGPLLTTVDPAFRQTVSPQFIKKV